MQSVRIPLSKISHWFTGLYNEDGTLDAMRTMLTYEALEVLRDFGLHSWCFAKRTSNCDALVSFAFTRHEPVSDDDLIMLMLTIES